MWLPVKFKIPLVFRASLDSPIGSFSKVVFTDATENHSSSVAVSLLFVIVGISIVAACSVNSMYSFQKVWQPSEQLSKVPIYKRLKK